MVEESQRMVAVVESQKAPEEAGEASWIRLCRPSCLVFFFTDQTPLLPPTNPLCRSCSRVTPKVKSGLQVESGQSLSLCPGINYKSALRDVLWGSSCSPG